MSLLCLRVMNAAFPAWIELHRVQRAGFRRAHQCLQPLALLRLVVKQAAQAQGVCLLHSLRRVKAHELRRCCSGALPIAPAKGFRQCVIVHCLCAFGRPPCVAPQLSIAFRVSAALTCTMPGTTGLMLCHHSCKGPLMRHHHALLGAARGGPPIGDTAGSMHYAMPAPKKESCCLTAYNSGTRSFTVMNTGTSEWQGPLHGRSSQCDVRLVSGRTDLDTVTLQGSRGAVHDKDHLLEVLLQVLGLNGTRIQESREA